MKQPRKSCAGRFFFPTYFYDKIADQQIFVNLPGTGLSVF